MGLLNISGSNVTSLAGIAVILGLAACGNSSAQNDGGGGNQGASSSGGSSGSMSSSGTGGSSGAGSSSGSGSGAGSSSGGSGSGGSGSSGASSSGGSSSGTDGGGSGGTGGDGGDASVGVNCVSADFGKPCSSFTTPTGTNIPLGPYGATVDVNVGKGFENTVQSSDTGTQPSATCQSFVNLFMEDPKLGMQLLTTTMNGTTIDFALYTVYRPAVWPSGPVPVITWGNGTCAQPEGYGALLRYVASYGYFIVAANSRQVGSANTTGTGSSQPMLRALDYSQAANMDTMSPYYQKLDMTKVGAMGHSQGSSSTATASSDSRIKDIILFNGGDTAPKPYLAISGDADITAYTASAMATAINGATVPAAYLFYHNPAGMGPLKGHLPLMLTPERVVKPTVAWWNMMFASDAASKKFFAPSGTCLLCSMDSSTGVGSADYGANSMLK
jgi:hypothetical protein